MLLKEANIYNSQGCPNPEYLRDNWLTALATLKELIQPLISEEMKEWREFVFNQIAPWFRSGKSVNTLF